MSTKFALLGLLNIKKMSAYDLEKFAKETIGYFWNESYSNIHRTLKILSDEKLIKKLPEKGSRNKNIFEITRHGQQALSQWLTNHQHTTIYRDELLLKLFVSSPKDYPALAEDLKNVLSKLQEQEEVYAKLQKLLKSKPNNLSYDLVLQYGIVENKATIAWLKDAIHKIERLL